MAPFEKHIEQLRQSYHEPLLIYHLDGIKEKFQRIKSYCHGRNIHILSAVKTFNHPNIHELSLSGLDGFDVSNKSEYESLPRRLDNKIVSLTSPNLDISELLSYISRGNDLHVNIDDISDMMHQPVYQNSRISYGVRVSHTSFDKNIDYPTGVDVSRFGVILNDVDKIWDILQKKGIQKLGLHTHNGSGRNTASFYEAAATQLLNYAQAHNIAVTYLNLGGGLHELSDHELETTFRNLRKIVPLNIPILFEPGQALYIQNGYLISRVQKIKTTNAGIIVFMDMSYEANTRWSKPRLDKKFLKLQKNKIKKSCSYYFYGATCFENDMISKEALAMIGSKAMFEVGDVLVWNMISGYSHGWNKGFNGISPIKIDFWHSEK